MAGLIAAERACIDAFHERFINGPPGGVGSADPQPPANANAEPLFCGGCGANVDRNTARLCGACRCTAYCGQECQRTGWKAGRHRAACPLLARARALPPPDQLRSYVLQLKLVGRDGLERWARALEEGGERDMAAVHRHMAAAMAPRERVLMALEARHHALLRFEMVAPDRRLEAHDLALFALRATLEPNTDLPTLNMTRDSPQRPYAIWIPSGLPNPRPIRRRPMANPVGRLLAGAGLATSHCYVGGGFCAESRLYPRVEEGGALAGLAENIIGALAEVDPDFYSEDDNDIDGLDDEDEDEGLEEEEEGQGVAAGTRAGSGCHSRVVVVAGMHMFGPVGEADDPLLGATAAALRAAGSEVVVAMYPKGGNRQAQEALARQLTGGGGGGFTACVVLGLGSGDDFKPRNPTHPWADGPWRSALTDWVRAGGVLVLHGERAAAAVARSFFGLPWSMEGDFYRRTDHRLNPGCPLLPGDLARRLPPAVNVKACMLGSVPQEQRLYAIAAGSVSHSLVPFMAGEAVGEGRCAMAASGYGSGVVVFFGDVNWERPTMEAVGLLVRELAAARAVGAGAGEGR